ncbi:MAG: hypothetical protein K0R49_364, partial [Burkholderiales bacterium]|nr:hypothetical protein [Burkholderiales bacterium]
MNKKVLLLITMLTMGTYYAQATPEWNVTINNHSGNSIEVGGIDLSQSHCWWTDPTSEGGNSFWQQRSLGNNESGVWKSPEMDFSQYNCNWGGDAHSLIARLDSQNLVLIAHYPNFYTSTPNNDWNWDIRINNTILNNTTKIPIE